MTKQIFALTAVTLLLQGCVPVRPVEVLLYPDGRLETNRIALAKHEVSSLVKETRGRPIKIVPVGEDGKKVTFTQAAVVRDQLKAQGIRHVTIAVDDE